MALLHNDLRLFGLDLNHLRRDLRRVADCIRKSPLLTWIAPQPLVRLRQADGQFSVWQMGDSPSRLSGAAPDTARFSAMELPSDLCLQREFLLPSLPDDQVHAAAALDVQSNSPFGAADLVWGHSSTPSSNGQLRVVTVMASRQQTAQYLQSIFSEHKSTASAELWTFPCPGDRPVLLTGFGEGQRLRHVASARRWGLGLLLLAMLLLTAVFLTPTVQLHLRAKQAGLLHEELVQRSSTAVAKREALLKSIEEVKTVSDELANRVDPFRLMEVLTQTLPDDTSVNNLKLQARKVTISGVTADASALMQVLGALPGLRDVRAPSAATRTPGAQRESFMIEFLLDPKSFAVQTVPIEPSPSVAVAPPAGTPAPAPSFGGGGAVFGGSSTKPASVANASSSGAKP